MTCREISIDCPFDTEVEYYPGDGYIETKRENVLSKKATLSGQQYIKLARHVVIKEGAVVRGDLAPVTIGQYTMLQPNVSIKPPSHNRPPSSAPAATPTPSSQPPQNTTTTTAATASIGASDTATNTTTTTTAAASTGASDTATTTGTASSTMPLDSNLTLASSPSQENTAAAYTPVTVGSYVFIDNNSVIEAASIGSFVRIGQNAVIGSGCIIKDCCLIAAGAVLPSRSVVAPYTVIRGDPATSGERLPYSFRDMQMQFVLMKFDSFRNANLKS